VSEPSTTWEQIAARNSRCVQTLIGWIFWDPGAVSRYEELGLNGPLGYIAARAYPFAGAGAQAVCGAFGSISPLGIGIVFAQLQDRANFEPFWDARNAAVLDGLATYAPEARSSLAYWATRLWSVVDELPTVARPLFASHLEISRSSHASLDGWHAVNCLREWRGDTHWAIVAAHSLSGAEASILHNAWLRYEGDWLSLSRGNTPESIEAAWRSLEQKGLARDHVVTRRGLELRERIEVETDRASVEIWRRLGEKESLEFAEAFEAPCVKLLDRVDATAGTNYQPASRVRTPWNF
jgi:hypothetical protein